MPWSSHIEAEFEKPYFQALSKTLAKEAKQYVLYPPKELIFSAFDYCELENVKVVIIGQDCYHGPNQAHGLAFSVNPGVPIPPSLKNIFKELHSDLNISIPNHGSLISWSKQGVLLLNAALTVRAHQPNSHAKIGWEIFMKNIIEILNMQERPICYLLWGKFARSKAYLITNPKHLILEAGHPSFYSCKLFFGCKHFSKANQFLLSNGSSAIDWQVE